MTHIDTLTCCVLPGADVGVERGDGEDSQSVEGALGGPGHLSQHSLPSVIITTKLSSRLQHPETRIAIRVIRNKLFMFLSQKMICDRLLG